MTILKSTLLLLMCMVLSCSISFSQSKINSKKEGKIIEIMQLEGGENAWKESITNYFEILFDKNEETYFLTELKNELLTDPQTYYYDLVAPIYEKYYTEEDLDTLIDFYKTSGGKTLIEKQKLIRNEALLKGKEAGELASEKVLDRFNKKQNNKFNKINTGCAAFHTGTFSYENERGETYKIVRTEKYQYEYFGDNEILKAEINWIDDCRYELKATNDVDQDQISLITNIFEIADNTAYSISTAEGSGIFLESQMTIVKD